MNTTDIGRIRIIMKRMRESRLTSTNPQLGDMYKLGIMASGLDKIATMMVNFSRSNDIQGISNPEAFNKSLAAAQMGMKMGNLAGMSLMRKFVSDEYQYVVHPAVRSLGKAGGKYGNILQNYMKAKVDLKKSFGDIGSNIGAAASLWAGRLARGVRAVSLAAAGTGAGIPVALAGLAVSAAIQIVASLLFPLLGRKIGEAVADNTEYVTKYSKNVLAEGVLATIPEGIQHYAEVAPAMMNTSWFDPKIGYASYFSTMENVQKMKSSTGISMKRLGISARETGSLYSAVGKNVRADGKDRGGLTSLIGSLNKITDEDVLSTFSGISQGSALSKTRNVSGEINSTADAFAVFFDALTSGQKGLTKASLDLTKSLAASADEYSRQNLMAKDTDVLFAGVQKFVGKRMQAPGQQDTSAASGIIGIMDDIAKGTGSSALATQLTSLAGIGRTEALLGLDEDKFSRMTQAVSSTYNFGEGASVGEDGKMKLDENAKATFAQLHQDMTRPQQEGGRGMSSNDVLKLAQFIVAYQDDPSSLKFGDTPATNATIREITNALNSDVFYTMNERNVTMTDNYDRLTSKYTEDMKKLNVSVLNATASLTESIAIGAFDLLATALVLTGGKPVKGSSGNGTDPSNPSYSVPNPSAYSGPVPSTVKGVSTVGAGGAMLAPTGFKEESDAIAKKVGIDPKMLYAFFGAESSFGTNTANYANAPFVGVGQVGVAAETDVNNKYGSIIGRRLNRNVREDNMLIAAYYVKYISQMINSGDAEQIYAAYNRGFNAVISNKQRNGGFNPNDFGAGTAELATGLSNTRKSLAGYDQLTSSGPVAGIQSAPGAVSADGLFKTVNYAGGVVRGADLRKFGKGNSSRISSEAKLFKLSGGTTAMGNKTAAYLEQMYAAGGRGYNGSASAFYELCATVAGAAIDAAEYSDRARGSAEEQRALWENGSSRRNAVFNLAEIKDMGGFEPGDMIYVRGGNHVGIVVSDGSIIQAGYGQDTRTGSYLVRTDATTFEYQGVNNIMVVRPSVDSSMGKSDGIVTAAERYTAIMRAKSKAATISTPKPTPVAPPAPPRTVVKAVPGTKYIANTTAIGAMNQFVIKKSNSAGLSNTQIAKIVKQEAQIEKALGLSADQLAIGTKTSGSGAQYLDIRINVKYGDVGKTAQRLLKEIERFI